jgi:hypothetical protein
MRQVFPVLLCVCLAFVGVAVVQAQCCPGGCGPQDTCQPPKVEQGTAVEGPALDVIKGVIKTRPLRTIIKKEIHKFVPQPQPAPVPPAPVVPPAAPDTNDGTYRGTYRLYHTDNGTLILTPIVPDVTPDVCNKVGDFHGGPGPRPGPGPMPHPPTPYGGGYGHGYGWHRPYFNPLPYIVGPVINYATQPRMVPNPVTGQMEYRSPGRWTQTADGAWAYMPMAVWPLGSSKDAETCGATLEVPVIAVFAGPVHKAIHAIREAHPVRRVVGSVAKLLKHKPVRTAAAAVVEKHPVRSLLGRLFHRHGSR